MTDYQQIVQQAQQLLGLTSAAEAIVRLLNETRAALKMPPAVLVLGEATGNKRGRPRKQVMHEAPAAVAALDVRPAAPVPLAPPPAPPPAPKPEPKEQETRLSPKGKEALGNNTAQRWADVKEAGIDTGGKLPTNEQWELAKKIKARRASQRASWAARQQLRKTGRR